MNSLVEDGVSGVGDRYRDQVDAGSVTEGVWIRGANSKYPKYPANQY